MTSNCRRVCLADFESRSSRRANRPPETACRCRCCFPGFCSRSRSILNMLRGGRFRRAPTRSAFSATSRFPNRRFPNEPAVRVETSGIGWQLKPYIIIEKDLARGRSNFVRLSEAGQKTPHQYHHLAREIEETWLECFNGAAQQLREALTTLLTRGQLSEGLRPPPGTTSRRRADACFRPA